MDLKQYQTAATLQAEINFWKYHLAEVDAVKKRQFAESKRPPNKSSAKRFRAEDEDDELEDYEVLTLEKGPEESSLFKKPEADLKFGNNNLRIYSNLFGLGFSLEIYRKGVNDKIKELENLFHQL